MPGVADELRYWSTRAADAHHNLLDTIQNSAGKWQAAIAGFLGLYATAGFVLSPNSLADLPVHGSLEVWLLVAYGIAGACGVAAIVYANLAAQGIPEILTGEAITGPRMRQLVYDRAVRARGQLGAAIRLAAIAGILVLAISAFLLVAGLHQASRSDAVVVTKTGAYCGQLRNSGGKLSLILPTGRRIPVAGAAITQVSSCPP